MERGIQEVLSTQARTREDELGHLFYKGISKYVLEGFQNFQRFGYW